MQKKIRVMFVVLQLDAGGSERVVYDLASSLDPTRFEIYIATFKSGVLADSLMTICKKIYFIKKRKGFDLLAMLKVANIIRSNKIDVVNAHHYMPCFYSFIGTKILNLKKLIYTEHSVPEVKSIASSFHGKIFYWMLFRINTVVGVSGEITKQFREKFPRHADKFQAILNGVDLKRFRHKRKEERNDIRSQWGLSNDHFVIGTIANFRKIKNHCCIVRAISHLKNSHPRIRVLFVGTGFPGDSENSEEEIRSLTNKLGLGERVIFTGYQENIPRILSALDAFCLPSFSEGLPVSLLEAMASGVPVIGSEVNGITELIRHKETGLLFTSNDDKELARQIKNIFEEPMFARTLSQQAFDFVKNKHSSEVWVKDYADLFEN